ncbi:MAG: hypothetical protein JWM75_3059 [Sphingomonas bacterium]|nr:hypothetical protein [Sphingomonas bacterium]
MAWRLAGAADAAFAREHGSFIKRFDARFWTVDFPRPMMASVRTTAANALRVDALFYKADDLAGLIWASEDVYDHPLLGYETSRDYRACRLSFRWRSGGLKPLDAIKGPTLTIEGRDAEGAPRAWYVRLWNYAVGAPEDARIVIDFAALKGGFLLPDEADPVWAGDIDRMFISLVPPEYDETADVLAAPVEAWAELSELACDGAGSVLAIGDVLVPAHRLQIATGYDDSYNQTPARLLRNAIQLGYRGAINHYVGMSHYFRLDWDAGPAAFLVDPSGALNGPCAAWHADFAQRAGSLGFGLILSLSYELFDAHAPSAWKQRAENGDPALTGWSPPSTLLSPANADAMAHLRDVARAFVAIAAAAGQPVRFQIGEPWWWIMPDGRPCLYDDAAKAAFGGSPVSIPTVRAPLGAAQTALLDAAGAVLATSTAALRDAVRDAAAGAEVLLLAYLPTVLDAAAPEIKRANLPIGWASPAFDRLQLEDYDWVTSGNRGATARGVALATARLGYPVDEQHYFAGFVLLPDQAAQWGEIDAAAEAALARGTAEVFAWALPQVTRDGFVHFEISEEDRVQPFDDVSFPIALGREASVEPAFSTAIVTTAAGHEQRNADWSNARLRFDAGPGVRSEADIQTLIGFFRARRGAAKGFRFRDPFDDSSSGMTDDPGIGDQLVGVGDGVRTRFELTKHYGEGADAQRRRITRPVPGSVRVAIDGGERHAGWTLESGGIVAFYEAPGDGVGVTAGYRFDVPVRFAEDRLEVSRAGFAAGEAPTVPLIEIREG